jgi:hypothetical protein
MSTPPAARALALWGDLSHKAGMASLESILTAEEIRPKVVDACARLVDDEVAGKSGLGGLAIKAAYKVVKKVKPGMIKSIVNRLLPEFAEAMDSRYQAAVTEAEEKGEPLKDTLSRKLNDDKDGTADALLGVTDAKISEARPTIRKAYQKLRGTAQGHVGAAIPGLARVVCQFV